MDSYFITRVELLDATENDYLRLQAEMDARGFSRVIPNNDGRRRTLPTGMYFIQRPVSDPAAINNIAVEAADKTKRKHRVISFRTDLWASNITPGL
jgi:hypothetical protein